jgi:hypothetical protein
MGARDLARRALGLLLQTLLLRQLQSLLSIDLQTLLGRHREL